MDRRSWLWRRKSSDKCPVETDSSGSFSSHSERFSDDQVYLTHNPQSPEVTSKAATADEKTGEDVKTLSDKLSAALLNISAKEDLAKQHAKVAEEAVSGWEKAEKELLSLKQQLEATTKKNSGLESRVGQLDAALKECVRRLRQAREEQEQRINEALARKTSEWEFVKSELEAKVVDLQNQLQTTKTEAAGSVDSDLRQKLETVEKDNSSLKRELLSQATELEIRIKEQDLITQAAETASKQHLESIRKVAKLEAECRRLNTVFRKLSPENDHKSVAASSIYVESLTDSQSDSGDRQLVAEGDANKISGLEIECEAGRSNSWASTLISGLNQSKNQKNTGRNSFEIDLMDDFLEMERLAAMPDTENGSYYLEAGPFSDQANGRESQWKAEHGAMIHRISELEERLKKLEEEKIGMQKALTERERQLEMSQSWLKEADEKLLELQSQLALASKVKAATEEEMKSIKSKKEVAESRVLIAEAENKSLLDRVGSLCEDIEKEQALSAETLARCQILEDELSQRKREAQLQHEAQLKRDASVREGLKIKQEKELAVAASKFAECQKTISSLSHRLKSLATMQDFLVDYEDSLDHSGEGPKSLTNGSEQWKLHPGDKCIHVDS